MPNSKADERALDFVLKHVDPAGEVAERRAFEQTWFGNLAYYSGHQHFVSENGTIRLPRRLNPRKTHYKENFILPAVERNVARLNSMNVDYRVAPRSPDLRDREAARIAERLFDYLRIITKAHEARLRALRWAAICGSGFRKITWDPLAGEPFRVFLHPETKEPYEPTNPIETRELTMKGLYRDHRIGEVCVEVVPDFQIHWDWKARDGGIVDASWMAQESFSMIDDLRDRYGTKAVEGVERMETDSGSQRYEDALSTMTHVAGLNLGQFPQTLKGDRTRTIEWFQRPDYANPKGRYVFIAGGKVIRNEDNPYAKTGNPLPFVKNDWFKMPGRFIGESLVSQIRTPQKALNESRSVSYDIEKTHGWPLTVLDKNADVQRSKLTSLPGVVLEANMRQSPNPVQFIGQPALPPYIAENADRSLAAIHAISAAASPAKGDYPAGVRSGLAIQAIQDDRNAILHPIAQEMAEAEADVGRMLLQIIGLNYDLPRLVQTMGKGGDFEPMYFAGADLRGHYNVRVDAQTVRVETPSAHQERIAMMLELGILDPNSPTDRVAILKAMDARSADEVMNDQLRDERQEEKWLQRMIQQPGFQAPILGVEDPHVRSKVLERFIKTDDYWMIEEPAQQAIYQRWQKWSEMIQAQLEAQMQLQQMAAGSQARETGTPSRPKRQAANTP